MLTPRTDDERHALSKARRLEARANSLRGDRKAERDRLLRSTQNIRDKIRKSHATA